MLLHPLAMFNKTRCNKHILQMNLYTGERLASTSCQHKTCQHSMYNTRISHLPHTRIRIYHSVKFLRTDEIEGYVFLTQWNSLTHS